jgi:hypothetical protein
MTAISTMDYVEFILHFGKSKKKKISSNHIFDVRIDRKRFMEAAIPVVKYILQNKQLFTKHFIAFAAQDDEDCSWTAVIAMNCGEIDKKDKGKKRGYFMLDSSGRRKPEDPPSQCRFFLKLAHHWILCAPPITITEKKISKYNNCD